MAVTSSNYFRKNNDIVSVSEKGNQRIRDVKRPETNHRTFRLVVENYDNPILKMFVDWAESNEKRAKAL